MKSLRQLLHRRTIVQRGQLRLRVLAVRDVGGILIVEHVLGQRDLDGRSPMTVREQRLQRRGIGIARHRDPLAFLKPLDRRGERHAAVSVEHAR